MKFNLSLVIAFLSISPGHGVREIGSDQKLYRMMKWIKQNKGSQLPNPVKVNKKAMETDYPSELTYIC